VGKIQYIYAKAESMMKRVHKKNRGVLSSMAEMGMEWE